MPNPSTEWLASVSSQCRKITALAGLALRRVDEYESPAARAALKVALKGHYDALTALLPEDFPISRRPDLARHIGFCEPTDWHDMVIMDVPEILADAEKYALAMPASTLGELERFIHPLFRPRLELTMAQAEPDYHALMLSCSVDLATLFKKHTQAADDSEGEMGKAFGGNPPKYIVPTKLETETDRNIQRGALMLMQGWRAFIRNPHSHEVRPTDQMYMVHGLMLMSFLARIIDGATAAPPPP
jgi:hypothetical protein